MHRPVRGHHVHLGAERYRRRDDVPDRVGLVRSRIGGERHLGNRRRYQHRPGRRVRVARAWPFGVAGVILERHFHLDLLVRVGRRERVGLRGRGRNVGLGVTVDPHPLVGVGEPGIAVLGLGLSLGVRDAGRAGGQHAADRGHPRNRRLARRWGVGGARAGVDQPHGQSVAAALTARQHGPLVGRAPSVSSGAGQLIIRQPVGEKGAGAALSL